MRSIGLYAAIGVIVSNVVGQGVFLKARAMTCDVGAPWLVIAAWVVAGLLSLAGALTIAELGALRPESGGPYAFLRRAYGEIAAFPYAWLTLAVGAPASTAALAAGTAIFAHAVAPNLVDAFAFGVPGSPFHLGATASFAVAITLVLAAVNAAPALFNGGFSTAFAALKIAMLVAIPAVAFAFGKAVPTHFAAVAGDAACDGVPSGLRGGVAGFAAALVGALYSYLGWASLPMIAGEIKLPRRNIPIALATSMAVIMVAYVATNAAYFAVLSPHEIASLPAGTSVGVAAVERVFGAGAGRVCAALLFLSVLSALHVTLMTWPRVLYAAACDGMLPRALAHVSRGARVPTVALAAQTVVTVAMLFVGSFDTLSDVYTFAAWVAAVFMICAVFVSRRREPDALRPYRVIGYPLVPALFAAVGVWLVVQTALGDPRSAALGLGAIALGFAGYAIRARLRRVPTRSL